MTTDVAASSAALPPLETPSEEEHRRIVVVLSRAHAGHVPGRARPDDRVDRAADHRRRSARAQPSVLGGDGLPSHLHHLHTALGQARGPVRPEEPLPAVDRDLPDRLHALGPVAEHDGADRIPGRPGGRRGRPFGGGASHHRRRRAGTPAWEVHGLLRRRLRADQRRRPAGRRPVHPTPVVALDLLHQRAVRHSGPVRHCGRAAPPGRPCPAQDRLGRHCAPLGRRHGDHS